MERKRTNLGQVQERERRRAQHNAEHAAATSDGRRRRRQRLLPPLKAERTASKSPSLFRPWEREPPSGKQTRRYGALGGRAGERAGKPCTPNGKSGNETVA